MGSPKCPQGCERVVLTEPQKWIIWLCYRTSSLEPPSTKPTAWGKTETEKKNLTKLERKWGDNAFLRIISLRCFHYQQTTDIPFFLFHMQQTLLLVLRLFFPQIFNSSFQEHQLYHCSPFYSGAIFKDCC